MKSDIVKPMPPRMPAPKTCFQLRPSGRRQMPTETAIKLSSVIPIGLPIKSPEIIPGLFVVARPGRASAPTTAD